MRAFVTGATGLIGAGTVRALVAAGHEVIGLTSREAGRAAIERMGARAIIGDMRDAASYREAARTADAIVHAAAAFPDTIRYSKADVDAFVGADADAVDALLRVAGPSCKKLVFSSGAYVYGDTGPTPVEETHGTERHHAVMERKLEIEGKLRDLARSGGIPAVIARCGMVLGDGSLWGKLYLAPMRRGRRAMLPGPGRNVISFVHQDDAGTAYLALIEHGVPGDAYSVADDEPAPLGDVVRAQAAALGAPAPFSVPAWLVRLVGGPYGAPATLAHSALSNRKLRGLGWAPRYPTYRESVAALASAIRAR